MESLLLVEDKAELRAMMRKALERAGYSVDEAPDGTAAIQKVRARRYLLVITDLKMPGASGLDVLRETKQADATIPVLLLTAYGSVEEAVSAMKDVAFDFLQKPVDLDHLKLLVQRAARQQELLRENLLLREEYTARYGFPRIVGEHASIREISQQIQRIAATDSTALLLGESGTGKELFARAIHHLSNRRQQPFVALNCAAIPEGLVENELFGHERGAFTGAGARKVGKMDLAHHGTLFLDEIGELPLAIQAKLLRVLEERRFERVGGTQLLEVDVRIIVATNRDLQKLMQEKLFREDLYFRISAVPITIPALRDRGNDVLLLTFFSTNSAVNLPGPASSFPLTPSKDCLSIAGLETSANCKTRSSAPSFLPMDWPSAPTACSSLPPSRMRTACPTGCYQRNLVGRAPW